MPSEIPLRWLAARGLALVAALWFTALTVLGVLQLLRDETDIWWLVVFVAVAACLAWVVVVRIGDAPSRILIRNAGWWAAFLGIPAFAVGFIGPMILMPEANQGPLIGFLLTGPLGAFLGVIVGVIRALPAYRTARREADQLSNREHR